MRIFCCMPAWPSMSRRDTYVSVSFAFASSNRNTKESRTQRATRLRSENQPETCILVSVQNGWRHAHFHSCEENLCSGVSSQAVFTEKASYVKTAEKIERVRTRVNKKHCPYILTARIDTPLPRADSDPGSQESLTAQEPSRTEAANP